MAYRILLRRDTLQNWSTNNPVLLSGEPGFETNTGKLKIGDGVTPWNGLQYYIQTGPTGATGSTGSQGATGNPYIELTYMEFTNTIQASSLMPGYNYLITDFKTCYNVPDYDVLGDAKPSSAIEYVDGDIVPILVTAISNQEISTTAYQPTSSYDRIQYDWTWNATEITGDPAYGRITERIDEYNNRTDYDHRFIRFIRYQAYNKGTSLSGKLYAYNAATGVVTGTNTLFISELSVNQVIMYDDGESIVGIKVALINSNTEFIAVVDPNFSGINFTGATIYLYRTVSTGIYNQYKEFYVGQKIKEDFNRYETFRLNGSAVHNYIGDYSKFYINDPQLGNSGFLLANNVFWSDDSSIYSNTIGDRSYNNTARFWFVRNTIAGRFYNNVCYDSGFYENSIGEYFDNNTIYADFYENIIDGQFGYNLIYSGFNSNSTGSGFNSNKIYSTFYNNTISGNFASNTLGDYGNVGNFEFSSNQTGYGASNNIFKGNFYDNKVADFMYNNTFNGETYYNVIGNDFYLNQTGYNFYQNTILDQCQYNPISDEFNLNEIGQNCQYNLISYSFSNNNIDNNFSNNTFGDTQYFNWNNTSIGNLTARTYSTFANAFDGSIDERILGKQLIMHDTVNNEYHKIIFKQWTLYSNGGGFAYERTKVYPTSENPTIYFMKTNYGSEVDVISPGVLEITRGNSGAIYNAAEEGGWNGSNPYGTAWNSIYTQSNNGSNSYGNVIAHDFKGNLLFNGLSSNKIDGFCMSNQFFGQVYSNTMGTFTTGNDFLGDVIENSWGDNFSGNGPIDNNFNFNRIGYGFYENTIGKNFGGPISFGDLPETRGNKIGDNFSHNMVKDDFVNNTVANNFVENVIGSGFQENVISTTINYTDLLHNYGNITSFTYTATGSGATGHNYVGLTASTNGYGMNATFNVGVSGGVVTGVTGNAQGVMYSVDDVLTIYGTEIGGTGSDNITITVTGTSPVPVVYENQTKQIFQKRFGGKSVSYYDENNVLSIDPLEGISFTIRQEDFDAGNGIGSHTTPIGPNGVNGFINTQVINGLYTGYYATGLVGDTYTQIQNAYNALGFSTSNDTGYIWRVDWATGSTVTSGLAKFGANLNGGYFDIQAVDPNNSNWKSDGNNNGSSLLGTFKFPATLTIYRPITSKSDWC
jgi:hypothetical protein